MTLQARFEEAQVALKNLEECPDNMTLLEIYALYKQASAGDISGERPGFTDMVARAKYDAWAGNKGLPKDVAMQKYIDLIADLQD